MFGKNEKIHLFSVYFWQKKIKNTFNLKNKKSVKKIIFNHLLQQSLVDVAAMGGKKRLFWQTTKIIDELYSEHRNGLESIAEMIDTGDVSLGA